MRTIYLDVPGVTTAHLSSSYAGVAEDRESGELLFSDTSPLGSCRYASNKGSRPERGTCQATCYTWWNQSDFPQFGGPYPRGSAKMSAREFSTPRVMTRAGRPFTHASEVSRCFDPPRRNRHCLPFNAMTSEATKRIFCRQGLRMSVVGHLSSRLNDRSTPESLRSPLGWQLNSTALCEY